MPKTELIELFRIHLNSDEFRGTGRDRSRKDWIATEDVLAWLSRIAEADTRRS